MPTPVKLFFSTRGWQDELCVWVTGRTYLVTSSGPTEISGGWGGVGGVVLSVDFHKATVSPYVWKEYFTGTLVRMLVKVYFLNLPAFSLWKICLPYVHFKVIWYKTLSKISFHFISVWVWIGSFFFLFLDHLEPPHGNVWAENMIGQRSHILYCWDLNWIKEKQKWKHLHLFM